MSLARKAARGALWTVMSSISGRAIGVFGTLIMTRFLHPAQIGEVSEAAVEVTWHATLAYAVLGTISLGLVALFGGRLAPFLDAPHAAAYVPAMALAFYI